MMMNVGPEDLQLGYMKGEAQRRRAIIDGSQPKGDERQGNWISVEMASLGSFATSLGNDGEL
jgi:hypothetical protein